MSSGGCADHRPSGPAPEAVGRALSLKPASDEALMAAYVGGDRQAFARLFERFAPLVTRVAARGLFDQSAVPDLVQRTFLHVHRARNDFRQGSKLRPWLMTIAMNVKRQHLRTLKRRREDALELDGRTDPATDPHDAAATQRARRLHAALAELPTKTREVIELHWLEGMPFPEVATVVGASLSAVKVRAFRGYARLRTILEKHGVTVADLET